MYLKTMLNNYSSPLKSQIETLCDVIELLEKKLTENWDKYENAPLSITIHTRDGHDVERTNPFCQEYRATMRDYEGAIRMLQIIVGQKITDEQVSTLNDLREKYKIS